MAEGPKKKRGRRAYLDDFVRDARGDYVYTGRVYRFDGDEVARRAYAVKIGAFTALTAFLVTLQEWFDPVPMSRSYWTLIPWLLQVIVVAMTTWSAVRLLIHFTELRAYVYEATVPRLPRLCVACMIASGVTLTAQVVYLVVFGIDDPVWLTVIRPVFVALAGLAAFLLYRVTRSGRWN